jgi:hypothetical protein
MTQSSRQKRIEFLRRFAEGRKKSSFFKNKSDFEVIQSRIGAGYSMLIICGFSIYRNIREVINDDYSRTDLLTLILSLIGFGVFLYDLLRHKWAVRVMKESDVISIESLDHIAAIKEAQQVAPSNR